MANPQDTTNALLTTITEQLGQIIGLLQYNASQSADAETKVLGEIKTELQPKAIK
jgi:hypothetical protein